MFGERIHAGCAGDSGRLGGWSLPVLFTTALCVLACSLLLPGVASAAFTRPFVREITGTSAGRWEANPENTHGTGTPPVGTFHLGPLGVAVDGAGDVWVGETIREYVENQPTIENNRLGEFEPASAENKYVEGSSFPVGAATPPYSVAVESATTGDIYVTNSNGGSSVEVYSSAGKHLESWGAFNEPRIAIDNAPSTEILDTSRCSVAECTVYVLGRPEDGIEEGIEKFNSKGTAEPFADSGNSATPYVTGNKITGSPKSPTGAFREEDQSITVDSKGNIYAINSNKGEVYEYAPSGEFIRAFNLNGGLGPNAIYGLSEGIAVDPLSGRLLVSVCDPETTPYSGAIDEFETEGPEAGEFVAQITQTAAGVPFEDPVGMAFDSLGDLYVVDQQRDVVDAFEPGRYPPTPALAEPSERKTESASLDGATLNGSVNPAQGKNPMRTEHLEACYFQYTTETEFDASVKANAGKESEGFSGPGAAKVECTPPADTISTATEAPQPVSAPLKGLQAGVTYRYRLVAASGGPVGGSEATAALAFTAPAAPRIGAVSAQNVSSAFAELHAQVDPLGADTTYWFEYGPTSAYGYDAPARSVAAPYGAQIGAGGPTGGATQSVTQQIGGLIAGNTYHFRVVARNEIEEDGETTFGPETTYGSDQTFTTLPEPQVGLPDDRSYELVTPAQKEGGSDMFAAPKVNGKFFNSSDGTPAESGNGFLLETSSPFGEFPFAIEGAYVFDREPTQGKWSYTSLASRSLGVQSFVGALFDPFDFSRVAVNDGVGDREEPEGERIANLLGPPGAPGLCTGGTELESALSDNCYIGLHEGGSFHENTGEASDLTEVVGGSRELSHVVLESSSNTLCPGAQGVEHGDVLCEYSDGALALVNVKPRSESDQPVSECGAALGDPFARLETRAGSAYRAVSADGSRVLFTAPDPGTQRAQAERLAGLPGCWNGEVKERTEGPSNAPQLYVRLNGEQTLKLSAPEKGVTVAKGQEYPAYYVGASENGNDVFFATATWLTKDHPAGHDRELYECEIFENEGEAGCRLTRISIPDGESAKLGEVFTVLAASAEGEGSPKGEGSVVYFTSNAVLATNANSAGETASPGDCVQATSLGFCPLYRYQPARASSPASLTFIATYRASTASHAGEAGDPLMPAPTITQAYTTPDGRYLLFENDGGEEEDGQLYRYDAVTGALTLIADGGFTRSALQESSSVVAAGPVHAISENGEYVFFDSTDRLVPTASNQNPPHPTLDTYEWHDGVISLIGSGTDPGPTYFLGYSPYYLPDGTKVEGGNVFIGTHAQLTAVDTNSLGNIYDARICAAQSPCIAPPAGETAQCLGGTCQSPPAAPADPTATLLAPPGGGGLNPLAPPPAKKVTNKAAKCKRGYVHKKVKKKTECIKKPKPKKATKSAHANRRAH